MFHELGRHSSIPRELQEGEQTLQAEQLKNNNPYISTATFNGYECKFKEHPVMESIMCFALLQGVGGVVAKRHHKVF